MKKSKVFVSPTSKIYFLSHLVVFLIGVILTCWETESKIMSSIGASLIAAGIAGWIIYMYIITTKKLADTVKLLTDFGMVKIFPKRSISIREEYDQRVLGANNSIDIIGFGLSAFRQDHLKDFATWKKRAKFRILLIDPYYPAKENSYSLQRDSEEGNDPGTIESHVKQFISVTKDIVEEGRFEIKIYRCTPMINIFRIDEEILWGPYLIGEQSRNTPTFLINNKGQLFTSLTCHFDSIWNNTDLSIVPPDDYFD